MGFVFEVHLDSWNIGAAMIAYKETLEKTERAIKNEQSRDIGNIRNKTQNEYKQDKKHNKESLTDTQHDPPPPYPHPYPKK